VFPRVHRASKRVKIAWKSPKIAIFQHKMIKKSNTIPIWRDGRYSSSLLCSLESTELQNAWKSPKITIFQHKMIKKSNTIPIWRNGCHSSSLLCSLVSLELPSPSALPCYVWRRVVVGGGCHSRWWCGDVTRCDGWCRVCRVGDGWHYRYPSRPRISPDPVTRHQPGKPVPDTSRE